MKARNNANLLYQNARQQVHKSWQNLPNAVHSDVEKLVDSDKINVFKHCKRSKGPYILMNTEFCTF